MQVFPSKVGHLDVKEVLGEGATGVVYRAWDSDSEEFVALKVFRKELTEQRDFRENFETEIALQKHVSKGCVSILPVLDSGEDEFAGFWITMPYVSGEKAAGGEILRTLRDKMGSAQSERKLAESEVLKVAHDVLDALEHAHLRGVLHGDMKPENVLIHDDRYLITDFGMAQWIDADRIRAVGSGPRSGPSNSSDVMQIPSFRSGSDSPEENALIRIFRYSAPELQSGAGPDLELLESTDLYSVGVMVLELLTGHTETKLGETISGLREDLSLQWDEWLERVLARNPARRFSTVAGARRALKLCAQPHTFTPAEVKFRNCLERWFPNLVDEGGPESWGLADGSEWVVVPGLAARFLAKPVTQRLWREVTGTNFSEFLSGKDGSFAQRHRSWFGEKMPVFGLLFEECLDFCGEVETRLQENGGLPKSWCVRPPLVREWVVARGDLPPEGEIHRFCWNAKCSHGPHATPNSPAVSGEGRLPNNYGIYDMLGNLFEWALNDTWIDGYFSESVEKIPLLGGSFQGSDFKFCLQNDFSSGKTMMVPSLLRGIPLRRSSRYGLRLVAAPNQR